MADNGDKHDNGSNANDSPHSDWKQTVNDSPDGGTGPKRDTTSPGALNESGMPIPEMLIGKPMGSGTIAGYIGSGGMGDVYKIWNEHVNRFHAVKLLKHGSGIQAEKRFEREIKVTATFDHPNIVHVHGAGRWKGYLFLEMEYIEGRALDVLLQQNEPVPPVVALAIGIFVSTALSYAHNHSYTLDGEVCSGVIHRDLKPSNIMLANDGRLKLMDFGIAKPVGGKLTSLTMGNVVGSFAYLPPEQLDGCDIDLRADIYALGEVLYELVSGRPPFTAENQRKFIDNKVQGNYPSVDAAKLGVPAAFIGIIDKCMKVNPDARFQTAVDIVNALREAYGSLTRQPPETVLAAFVKGETIVTATSPTLRPKQIKPMIVKGALLAAAIIALVTSLIAIASHKPTPKTAPSDAVVEVVYPRDTLAADTLTVEWKRIPVAQRYRIHVASRSSFTDTIVMRTVADTTCAIAGIAKPGTYVWRIGAIDAQNTVAWSDPGYWTIAAKMPGIPVGVSPAEGLKGVETTVAFVWNAAEHAVAYRIQVATDREFLRPVFDSSGCGDTTITVASFAASTTYYWHVCGRRDSHVGSWSTVWSFTTAPDVPATISVDEQDYGKVATEALGNKRPASAETAIFKLANNDPRRDTLLICCAEAYFAAGNLSRTKRILKEITAIDKLADLLRGRVLIAERDFTTAYKVLDMAIKSPTKFKSSVISADVVYYRAVAATACWESNKAEAARTNAISAWKEVRTFYKNDTSHKRYRQAAEEATRIAD